MTLVEQITANLVDPDNHGPILKALIDTLEVKGERGIKELIERWVEEIEQADPPEDSEMQE